MTVIPDITESYLDRSHGYRIMEETNILASVKVWFVNQEVMTTYRN